ncbi:MAG: hypothetical protein LBQ73_01775 [Tannerellaceae bacterium]|jgi:hypothetical protein|nr:hypothetical protein [Tannerellaceae bacterium]
MKRQVKAKIRWILSALLFVSGLQAQVVIGSSSPSEPAALLQIKEYNAPSGSGGETAKSGGLLLPRVDLKGLSDVTVIPSNAGDDKKKELAGLLVYNVNTSGMEEGIYEWDGARWYLLEPISDVSGFSTRKKMLRGSMTTANAPSLRMGIFEFRISPDPDALKKKPQFRIAGALPAKTTFWLHVTRFWDYNEINKPNMQVPQVGYTFDVKMEEISTNDTGWHDIHSAQLAKEDQRYEVWLADPVNERLYAIEFLIFQSELKPAYAILATEY